MNNIILFDKGRNCCACGSCMNACPKQAISMREDEYGYKYPHIDEKKCVGCGVCNKVCAYQNIEVDNETLNAYVAVNMNGEQLKRSASGGVFAAMATKVLAEGGIVIGAALEKQGNKFVPHHIVVTEEKDLEKIQGSKYVQSDTENTYKDTLKFLKEGKTVLYSGTPCQIAGLYGFLGKRYNNLITVDLICHGVPNASMFNDYLKKEGQKRSAKEIISYKFRDKEKGWGMNGRIDYIDKNGRNKTLYIPARLTSYNTLFLDGLIYRENCYSCKYANSHRPGDITIGDYWGIEKEHPELLKSEIYDEKRGISCIVVNSEQGKKFVKSLEALIRIDESTFSKIANRNTQLREPSELPDERNKLLQEYKEKGYEGMEAFFYKKYKKQLILHVVYNAIPRTIRIKIKNLLKG